jgi:hypothetical protein
MVSRAISISSLSISLFLYFSVSSTFLYLSIYLTYFCPLVSYLYSFFFSLHVVFNKLLHFLFISFSIFLSLLITKSLSSFYFCVCAFVYFFLSLCLVCVLSLSFCIFIFVYCVFIYFIYRDSKDLYLTHFYSYIVSFS